ncbi:hypothetical protein [Methylobacterium fujisawaense]
MNPMTQLPWRLEHMPGGDIAVLNGRRSRDLVIAFSCYQPDWDAIRTDFEFNFLNHIIKSNNDGILIRDTSNGWYQFGVPGAEGSIYELTRFLERYVKAYDRVITIGSSMGGYAALLFGALLQVDRSVAIVPQINIGTLAAAELSDDRWATEYSRIDLHAPYPEFRRLATYPLPINTRFYSIYGDQDPYDMRHMQAIHESDIRTVLFEGQDHNGAARSALKSRMLDLVI